MHSFPTAIDTAITDSRRYKPGDRVRILDGSKAPAYCGGWLPQMQGTVGKVYTVKHHTVDRHGLFVNESDWAFDGRYVELAEVMTGESSQQGQAGGLKFDAGKDKWELLLSVKGMLKAVQGVVRVLMFGEQKYAAHSWRQVEDNERRYLDGLMRHYVAIMEHGLTAVDEESKLLHIDHLNCNGLFLAELARSKQ